MHILVAEILELSCILKGCLEKVTVSCGRRRLWFVGDGIKHFFFVKFAFDLRNCILLYIKGSERLVFSFKRYPSFMSL